MTFVAANITQSCTNTSFCLQFWVRVPSGWSPSGIERRCCQPAGPVAPCSCCGATSAPPESCHSSWWRRAWAEPDRTVSRFVVESKFLIWLFQSSETGGVASPSYLQGWKYNNCSLYHLVELFQVFEGDSVKMLQPLKHFEIVKTRKSSTVKGGQSILRLQEMEAGLTAFLNLIWVNLI